MTTLSPPRPLPPVPPNGISVKEVANFLPYSHQNLESTNARDHAEKTKEIEAMYTVLLARPEPDGHGGQRLRLAPLTESFREILQQSNLTDATQRFRDLMEVTGDAVCSEKQQDSHLYAAEFVPDQFDGPFVNAMRSFTFGTRSLLLGALDAISAITFLAFLPASPRAIQEPVSVEQRITHEEQMGIHTVQAGQAKLQHLIAGPP